MVKLATTKVSLENDWVMMSALREVLEMVVPRERLVGRGLIEQLTARMQATVEALEAQAV